MSDVILDSTISNSLQLFQNAGFKVRVIMRCAGPWFVAKDVCECLDLANSRDAVSRLDDDEKGVGKADTLGGSQEYSADLAEYSESRGNPNLTV